MCGCALKANLCLDPSPLHHAGKPSSAKGCPRSEVNTKGDFDTIFNQRKQHRIERSDD
jgi:hypothetical protein